ncbi:MAG: metal-dependent phosphohydrolase, partial [Nocardioidaceae bacterium]
HTGVAAPLVAEVARLVRLTAGHRPEPGDRAGQVLCDADLAILAAEDDRYADYLRGVREEHAHVDDDAFRAGRLAVLRDLLDRPRLFHTPAARQRWEARARHNLAVEVSRRSSR